MSFIDEHRKRFGGVQPICAVLTEHGVTIAPSTYYAAKARPPSARAVRDEQLLAHIRRVHADNYGVYGARKVWHELRREGHQVARCTVERLMRQAGLSGVVRGKKVRTTTRNESHQRSPDLLDRDFTAPAPNHSWVADFTHVASWAGIIYVAFVVDVFSRAIVGWSAAMNKRTKLVLDALDMALWRRDRAGVPVEPGLIHHSDSEYGVAGAPGLPDPHSDGRARMLVPDAPGLPDPHFRLMEAVLPWICRWPGSTR